MSALIHNRFPDVASEFTFRKSGQCLGNPEHCAVAFAREGMHKMIAEVYADLAAEEAARARQDAFLSVDEGGEGA